MRTMISMGTNGAPSLPAPALDPSYTDDELLNALRLASLTAILGYNSSAALHFLDGYLYGAHRLEVLAKNIDLTDQEKNDIAKMATDVRKAILESIPKLHENAEKMFEAADEIAKELALRGYSCTWVSMIYRKDDKALLLSKTARNASSMGAKTRFTIDFYDSLLYKAINPLVQDFNQSRKRAEVFAEGRGGKIPSLGLALEAVLLILGISAIVAGTVYLVIVSFPVLGVVKKVAPEAMRVIGVIADKLAAGAGDLLGSLSWLAIASGIAIVIGGILVVPRVIEYAEAAWSRRLPRPVGTSAASAATAATVSSLSPVPVVATLFK